MMRLADDQGAKIDKGTGCNSGLWIDQSGYTGKIPINELYVMEIRKFINDWIATGNSYDVKGYLGFYQADAVLDDPSVGRVFKGHAGIEQYFRDYFIGYKTHTRLVRLNINEHSALLDVEFTGNFPEGKLAGSFDFRFREGKIVYVKADLK